MKISKRSARRMENLTGLCDFDTAEKLATMQIHYSRAEEIVETTIGSADNPVIQEEAIEYLQALLDAIPEEFGVKVILKIDDYQDYDPQVLQEAYHATARILNGGEKNRNHHKKILMAIFVFLGLALLMISVLGKANNWFDFAGKGLSLIFVMLTEMLFEVYFEESFIFFTVSRVYKNVLKAGNERLREVVFI